MSYLRLHVFVQLFTTICGENTARKCAITLKLLWLLLTQRYTSLLSPLLLSAAPCCLFAFGGLCMLRVSADSIMSTVTRRFLEASKSRVSIKTYRVDHCPLSVCFVC